MALINTGLGWSADEDWLKLYGSHIGDIVTPGTAYAGQPIPYTAATKAAIKAGGLLAVETASAGKEYYSTQDAAVDIFICHVGDILYALSTTRGAHLNRFWNTDGGTGGTVYDRQCSSTISGVSGVYSWSGPSFSGTSPVWHVPEFDNLQDAANALMSHQSIYKLGDGYSVTCFIKAQGSPYEYVIPVQISSDPAYTALSTDGSTPASNSYASAFYYQGMRFVMQYLEPAHSASVSGNTVLYRDITNVGYMPIGTELFALIANMASITVTAPGNPYTDPDSSEAGGGGQDPDDDEVPVEPVSFPSALGTGFCRLYCPTAAQLSALSNYLWGPLFDLSTVKKLFADPMDSILGLSVVPISISGNAETVSVAGVSTGISLDRLSAQHVNVDLGSLQVVEKYGAYLDYEPFTKYSIYLPFIGYRSISADDVMGKWVHLSYDIDLLSGACVAKLVSGSTLLYQWAGTCAMQLPVNANNWNSVIQSSIAIIGSVATGIATGGAAAPMVAGALSSAATQAVMMKPSIERAGGLSGAAAFLSGRRAYMIRAFPRLVNPGEQPHYIGYPSYITKQLGSISGYNVVEDIHLEGIPATQTELEEIDTLLHEGVIL